jgi:hypothetical protein
LLLQSPASPNRPRKCRISNVQAQVGFHNGLSLYIRTALPCSAIGSTRLSVSSTYANPIGQRITQIYTVTLLPEAAAVCDTAGSNGSTQGLEVGVLGLGPINSITIVPRHSYLPPGCRINLG